MFVRDVSSASSANAVTLMYRH